ncbi:MAG: lysophospholipid acyltransferase family protein [Nitrospirae bacterium]|jgi:Kdo2-lipid IVA lauroyltransferase/acyltransferase|nr:lysophospholipid acyltransferase family protein [Nitrospirota bacterium]
MKKAVWFFETVLLVILSIPLAIMPLRVSMKAGEMLGLLLFYLWGSRRKIALDNLNKAVLTGRVVIPDPTEKIIKDNFKHLGMSFIEIIKIYYGFGKKILGAVDIEGIENFHAALSKGKGILFITGHCGNWELMALLTSARIQDIAVVARPMNNPHINYLIANVRKKYGNSVIHKKGALKPIIQTLRNNGCIGILMDQAVLAEEGYVIDFLGRGAWTTKIPALIARKTDAAVLPVFIHRTDRGHTVKVNPEVELSKNNDREAAVIEDTKRFSEYIERYIQEHPSEWLWIHRRWKRVSS